MSLGSHCRSPLGCWLRRLPEGELNSSESQRSSPSLSRDARNQKQLLKICPCVAVVTIRLPLRGFSLPGPVRRRLPWLLVPKERSAWAGKDPCFGNGNTGLRSARGAPTA